ncbi:MAG: Dam family site-specific DNA-(adenine-N6)-methyltransferase [Clostridiaceae bacterium]|nr:Dam family site-specific DNA-(adenine-N6)-methyltransferase [Clostridiaceae bacterium]
MESKKLDPFLKWPGGKRWFISKYRDSIPENFNRYIEPFLGGGSVFFALLPQSAIISDINEELINVYLSMQENPSKLADILEQHQKKHCSDYYYKVRSSKPKDKIRKAGRFLYLNRTCYNGMYRVNRQGMFNVPIGTKVNCTYDINLFEDYSKKLKNIDIRVTDFGPVIQEATLGDLVFVDPPYTVAHNQNCFIKYNESLFTWDDQKRLLNELCNAKERGAIIIATNANYDKLREMYKDKGFHIKTIERYSCISGKADKRGRQEELLITSIPIEEGK